MDVRESQIQPDSELPLTDKVLRHGLVEWKEKDKYTPSLRFFQLSQPDKEAGYGLSVDWDKKTTPEEVIARIGGSYKPTTQKWKQYKNREIYSIRVEFLKGLSYSINCIYNPIHHFDKAHLGFPNNPAHSLIVFDKEEYDLNEAEIITEIRNHAKANKVGIDMEKVDKLVESYRNL